MGARDALADATARGPLPTDAGAREYLFGTADFERVRRLIHARAGISLNDSKQNMVYSRLSRRLRATGFVSFPAYLDRLEHDAGFAATEGQEFVNALTTNLTAFFREPHHFPVLAGFLRAQAARGPLRLWCAAASTGEEPYSIAMTLIEALGASPGARLLASDIDTDVLAQGRRGVYRIDAVRTCGEARMRQFFQRGTGANEGLARVRQEVQRLVEFASVNLLGSSWDAVRAFGEPLDAVFCRNVMIYFDKPTQRRVLDRLATLLRPGGLLFVGHSENFTDCRETFVLRGKTVYERTGA
jgi:chemotaxis protein methyltransferase CheR